MGRLFGTNGVRGVFGKDFTLELVHDLTLAIARHFARGPILVGYDGRDTSRIVAKAVCSALNYSGLDCGDAGLVPTPCLEYCVPKLGYAGGMMITASHNPPEYNGIKPVAPDGVEISREEEDIIEGYYRNKESISAERWGSTAPEPRAVETYVAGVLSQVDAVAIARHNYTVVLDAGNGAQAVTAPLLCRRLNCNAILLNETIDGRFPGRGSEPTPDNLSELSDAVVRNKADVGMAFDGDGDRSIICDERGTILTGDRSALVLVRYLLTDNPGSTVVTCLNSGHAIEGLAEEYGSPVVRTRVGSVEVSRRMVSSGALAGFEENGGFMYGRHNQVRDGLMTLALALSVLESSGNAMSENVSSLPASFTTKAKVRCTPSQASKVIEALYRARPDSDTTDGIKTSLGPSKWVMIRPSGTEPIIRIYAEAPSARDLDALISEYTDKVRRIIGQDSPHFKS